MFRKSSGLPLYLDTLKILEIELFFNLEKPGILKNIPEFLTTLICSVVKFRFDTKSLSNKYFFFVIIINFNKKHI